MPRLELIYDPDCPNVEGARTALRDALAQAGEPPDWQEWNWADRPRPEPWASKAKRHRSDR